MGLHKKLEALLLLKPDIAVVPEAANRSVLERKTSALNFSSYEWVGENQNKGLGVFGFGAYKALLQKSHRSDLKWILPLEVEGPKSFRLLAVWACHDRVKSQFVLGPLSDSLIHYGDWLREGHAVVAGDFNNHVRWDRPGKKSNQACALRLLSNLDLVSAYHFTKNIEHGEEAEPTLYWRQRSQDGPQYHVDYCFLPTAWCSASPRVRIGGFDPWIKTKLSDHAPLIVDVD